MHATYEELDKQAQELLVQLKGKTLSAKERAQILRKWYDLMMENQEDLAIIMTAEQGKVLAESRGEVAYGAAFVEWFGEQANRIDGDVIPGPGPDRRIVCIQQLCRFCHAVKGGANTVQSLPGRRQITFMTNYSAQWRQIRRLDMANLTAYPIYRQSGKGG